MDLRTVLIVLVVLLCIYMAWLVMRWRRVQRHAGTGGVYPDPHAAVFRDVDRFGAIPVGGHAADTPTLLPEDDDSVVSLSPESSAHAAAVPNVRAPRPSEPDASGFGFDALLEVRQMRHLIDDLRSQQNRLIADVARLRDELTALRAASRVAPAYAEAVAMVQRGLDAQAIAERCGISVAEAELVRALSEQSDLQEISPDKDDAPEEQHDKNKGDMHG